MPQEVAHHRKEFYRGAGSIFPHQMGQISIRLKPNIKGKCCKSKEELCLCDSSMVLSLPGWGAAVVTKFWAGFFQAEHLILPQLLPAPSTSPRRQRVRGRLLGSLLVPQKWDHCQAFFLKMSLSIFHWRKVFKQHEWNAIHFLRKSVFFPMAEVFLGY